jgi:putative ABC transport system permease protein
MHTLVQDLRFAFRTLAKKPGFTLVAILTLALGIGANTAIFSVINAVLLKPLPYPEASRLVFLSESSEQVPGMSIAMANFNDWRAQNAVFESMVAFQSNDAVMSGRGEPERLRLRRITAGFTPTLQPEVLVGRALTPDDDKVGAARVVVLGEGFWERRFGRDPSIIGQDLNIDSEPYTVVGVFSSRLHGTLRQTDLFTSLWRLEDKLGGEANRGSHPGIYAYARLKPGVTVAQAQSEMKNIAQRLDQLHPQSNGNDTVTVQPLLDAVVEDVRPSLLVLMAAVGFVLLIACANIANLQLARATERYREIAVRMALGAGRARLIRQLLTENILLALAGGLFGIVLGVWLTSALVRATPTGVPRLNEVALDRYVLAFSVVLSILTGIFFGIFPALQASRASVNEALKEGSRSGSTGARRASLRDILVAAEVAISLILLVGAGLMTRSLWNVVQADGGISPAHVLTARYSLPDNTYADDAKRRAFIDQLTAKAQALPGVELAGIKQPLFGGNQTGFLVEGQPMPKPGFQPSVDIGRVTPDALQAIGIRLLQGRFFDAHDNESGQLVCIIDETFAKQYFPNDNPLGKRVSVSGLPMPGQTIPWRTVVGVVAHVKNYGIDQPSRVEAYVPFRQLPAFGGTVVLRAAGDPSAAVAGIRAAIHSLDPNLPVFDVRPLPDIVADSSASRRLAVTLIGSFAALALLLAAVGIYGVISYLVTQRRQEIGIRIALGATSENVLALILMKGARLAALGVGVGLLGALALTSLISKLLFQVSAFDVTTFALGVVILVSLVLLACWLPARRATRIDPLVALRYE